MAWYAVYRTDNGQLISITSVLADPLPAEYTASELAGEPASGVMWDTATRKFVARPAKVLIDRWNDLLTDANYADFQTVYNALNAANKTRLRTMLQRLFGSLRYRNTSEPIEF